MLGEISPHHEYYDSKSSTETPPSYNQLNYNENIERFFKSKPPVATMYGSDEENVNSSNDEGGKSRDEESNLPSPPLLILDSLSRSLSLLSLYISEKVHVTDKRQRRERQR